MNNHINQQLAEIRNNLLSITNQTNGETMNTQPTTGVGIDTPTAKFNKTQAARSMMRRHPEMSAVDIAKAIGCDPSVIYNARYYAKLRKKRAQTKYITKKKGLDMTKPATQRKPAEEGKASKALKVAVDKLQGTWTTAFNLSELRLSLAGFVLDLTLSGNTDLLKNKHLQNILKITKPSENTQL